MDHVQIAVAHLDQPIVGRHVVAVDDVLRRRLAEVGNRGAVPVLALLPDVPVAVRVEAVRHIRPQANGIGEVVLQHVLDPREDVFRHDPGGIPANRENRMKSRVRRLKNKMDGLIIHRLDAFDLRREGTTPDHSLRIHLGFDSEDNVISGELLAIAPVDVVAQVHRHLAEIFVVFGRPGRQRVVGHAVDALVGVDEPQRVHHQLMQSGRQSATGIDPDVEPAGIIDGPLGILQNQCLLAWQVLDRSGPAQKVRNGRRPR